MKKVFLVLLSFIAITFFSACQKKINSKNTLILNEESPHLSAIFLNDYVITNSKDVFILESYHKGNKNKKDVVMYKYGEKYADSYVLASFNSEYCESLVDSTLEGVATFEDELFLGYSNGTDKYIFTLYFSSFFGLFSNIKPDNNNPTDYNYLLTKSKRMIYNEDYVSDSKYGILRENESILSYYDTSNIEYAVNYLLDNKSKLYLIYNNLNVFLLIATNDLEKEIPIMSNTTFKDGIIISIDNELKTVVLDENLKVHIYNLQTNEKETINYSDAIDVVLLNDYYYVLYQDRISFHSYKTGNITTHYYDNKIIGINAWDKHSYSDSIINDKKAVIYYLGNKNTISCDKIDLS